MTANKKHEELLPAEELPDGEALNQSNFLVEAPHWKVAYGQSVGKVREHNEDSFLTLSSLIPLNGELLPVGIFIVADGMGGHAMGEVASDLAVRTVASHIMEKTILARLENADNHYSSSSIHEVLSESVSATNRLIHSQAPGSGTTLTALLILDKQMSIVHVGDSRAYTINQMGEVSVITRDHSLVNRMIELGQITEAEAASHPQRNVLYKALGQLDPLSPDITSMPLPEGGFIMLCSDGLWGLVPQNEIVRIIKESSSPETACRKLVESANQEGGSDNITVVLVQLS